MHAVIGLQEVRSDSRVSLSLFLSARLLHYPNQTRFFTSAGGMRSRPRVGVRSPLSMAAKQRDEENRRKGTARHKKRIMPGRGWIAAALVAACLTLGFGTAVHFKSDDRYRNGVSLPSVAAHSSADETIPPVGTRQHLELSALRYFAYQEERLKLMTLDIKGPEAVILFNLLVVDYNSRCSDFFY